MSEYRMDIDRLQREMQEIKKKYFLQKKKEQSLRMYVYDAVQTHAVLLFYCTAACRERDKGLAHSVMPTKRTELPVFKGGGFNLTQTQKALA